MCSLYFALFASSLLQKFEANNIGFRMDGFAEGYSRKAVAATLSDELCRRSKEQNM